MKWFRRRRADATAPVVREPDPAGGPGGVLGGGVGSAGSGSEPGALLEPAEAAMRFWARWDDLLPRVSAALGDREPRRIEHDLCEAVAAVHPDLNFSVDRGQLAIYSLVVSGQEAPELRPYTDALKAAAPPDDVLWEFHDSVPAVPDPNGVTVNLSGHRISLADIRVVAQVDEVDGVVDVAVYHPALSELDDTSRSAMTFLPLDATLGERLAAERLRRVETALRPPLNAITLRELRDVVRRLAEPAPAPGDDATAPTDDGAAPTDGPADPTG